MMNAPSTLKLSGEDGTSLHVVDWLCDQPFSNRRGVLIMHGLGEHGGRYPHVARFFNNLGLDARVYDHRGHGRSGGARGDVPHEEAVLNDAAIVLNDYSKRFDTPPLLLGHSMGGLFAARFATARLSPIAGLILSSPALSIPLAPAHKILLKVLGTVAPGLAVPNGLKTRYLSHDESVIDAYCKDPLVHPKISARLLGCMLSSVEYAQRNANQLAVPTLLVVAGADRLVDARGSASFCSQLRPGIGTIHHFDGFYHELFNEVDAARVFSCVQTWLHTHGFATTPAPAETA
jgi:alpha-beta hydrolase superfamily lysophospholipase